MPQLVLSGISLRTRFPFLPGLGLSIAVTLVAELTERLEVLLFGHAWLEALVLAIILGALWRHFGRPSEQYATGVAWSGKYLLEVAVVLLGASISAEAVAGAGPLFVLGVAGVVAAGIAISFTIGRLLGLGWKVSLLLACGNSICGNSAIAAVAPVIDANGNEIGSTIAFTAVLGVVAVLLMPVLCGLFGFDFRQYGVFAGLTVYAVPQVIAATAPVSVLSVGVGTLTKLIRVLMLGPTIFGIALVTRRCATAWPGIGKLLPWFIVGFLLAMGLRSFSLIPESLQAPIALLANALTVVSMAALGLSVDLRAVAASGGRVIAGATLSLLAMGCLAYLMVRLIVH